MIVITDPQFISSEADILNALFCEGLEILHLRKPDSTLVKLIELVSKIDEQFHSRIMIHSHYELLNSFQLKGLHFTEKSKHLLGYYESVECKKSLVVHELTELKNTWNSIDYVFLSPLFPSISKAGYSKQWDFEELKSELSIKHNFNVVALGGITLNNVKMVKELGFNDFAILGSVWEPVKSGYSIQQVIDVFTRFKNGY
ncbi:MAG: thiamine phosphate synthase [Peptostreptococcaceae bacterium]|nr:thiamine phosphate synthase [Peptostreptococcaceae bacterium]